MICFVFLCVQFRCSRPRRRGCCASGFKMPAGVPIPQPVAADSSGAGTEEDGMPKEDPSKLERAPGEENEEVRSCLVAQASASREVYVRKHSSPGSFQAKPSKGISRSCCSGLQLMSCFWSSRTKLRNGVCIVALVTSHSVSNGCMCRGDRGSSRKVLRAREIWRAGLVGWKALLSIHQSSSARFTGEEK